MRALGRGGRRSVRIGVLGAVFATLAAVVPAVASGPGPTLGGSRSNYIVQLRAEPLARAGHRPDVTSPAAIEERRQLDALEAVVLQDAGVAAERVGYHYRTTLAGFSARLTPAEAQRLRSHTAVTSVAADRTRSAQSGPESGIDARSGFGAAGTKRHHAGAPAPSAARTTGTAPVLATASATAVVAPEADVDTGLSGQAADYLDLPEGLWARLGGPDHAGEDVVVGVIDGGIYPEHPSFADEPVAPDGTQNYIGPAYGPPPATWRGTCQEGEAFPATTCNDKLIGARYFVDGLGAANISDEDFLSARDVDGHGTAMASIAAGNYGVDPSYLGNDLGVGVITGIAPRARVAHYKAFWAVPAANSIIAAESDLIAAIDAAVADGVDILSYSIGGPLGETRPISDQSTMLDPESQAMLRAFDAGVLPVLPSGNSGPDPGTHDAAGHTPWVISAGASGLSTTFAATATVSAGPGGSSVTVTGVSPTPAVTDIPLIDGAAAAAPGATSAEAGRCEPGSLDPALVKGKAVLCRPEFFSVGSPVLFAAGAAAGIFHGATRPLRDTYDVWLPSVIVNPADVAAIRRVMATTTNPTVSITAGTVTPTTTGDVVVDFSSRGPAVGSPDILKPDLVAPGTDAIVAHTPQVPPGPRDLFDNILPERFRPLGGTSVSVPNTAGAAALLRSLHPDFGPSELKSALMTTAQTTLLIDAPGTPSVPATPHDMGAGRIDPNRAADPGLVLTETTQRFESFAAGQVPTRDPSEPTLEPTDLNLPSIAFDPLIGPRSTLRTFTSVDDGPGTWTASVEGLAGISVAASPARFTIDTGQSQTVRFDVAPDSAPLFEYAHGAVVFTNEQDGRTVRLPVTVRPVRFEASEQLNFGAAAPAGHAPLAVPTGYEGQLSALGYGFAPPEVRRNQRVETDLLDDEDLDRIAQAGPGVAVFDLEVPGGAQVLAAELGGAELDDPLSARFADLDLYIFHDDEGDGFGGDDLVDASTTESKEAVLLASPEQGSYRISVRGLSLGPVTTFDLTTWVLDDAAPDVLPDPAGPGLRVGGDPLPVTVGGIGTLDLEWAGLDEPGVYLGLVTFHNGAVPLPGNALGATVVAVTRF